MIIEDGLQFVETSKFKKLSTGEKRYRAVFSLNQRGRYSRLMFKRAREAEAYGQRLAARGMRGVGCLSEPDSGDGIGSLGFDTPDKNHLATQPALEGEV